MHDRLIYLNHRSDLVTNADDIASAPNVLWEIALEGCAPLYDLRKEDAFFLNAYGFDCIVSLAMECFWRSLTFRVEIIFINILYEPLILTVRGAA
jgi:hypothetical protein